MKNGWYIYILNIPHVQEITSTSRHCVSAQLKVQGTDSNGNQGSREDGSVHGQRGSGDSVGGSRGLGGGGSGRGSRARLGGGRRGRRRRGALGGGRAGGVGQAGRRRRGAVVHLDAGVVAGLVGVLVVGGGVVVGNVDGLDVHDERNVVEVGLTTGPLDGALGVAGVTAGPDTDLELAGGLGVVLAVESIGVLDGVLHVAVDDPLDALLGPVDAVGVELGLGVGHGDVVLAVTEGAVTLSEVVGLDVGGVGADLLLFLKLE